MPFLPDFFPGALSVLSDRCCLFVQLLVDKQGAVITREPVFVLREQESSAQARHGTETQPGRMPGDVLRVHIDMKMCLCPRVAIRQVTR